VKEKDSALKFVYESLLDDPVIWALTGSFAFYIRGIDVSVGDIDIQTNESGAYEIARRLKRYVREPVQYRQAPTIRSHFGKFMIGGVRVEVMGDIEKRSFDGTWMVTPPLPTITETVLYNEMNIPVLNLEYECEAYAMMGRTDKARLLRAWLDHNQTC